MPPKAKRGTQPESTTRRAAIYVRVSTKGQEEEGTSLGTQEQRCLSYAAERGYGVDAEHIFRETWTGTDLWQRPLLTRLREGIRRRDVDVLIVYAIDRLSRDPVHLGVILSEADHAGVTVEFVSEQIDDSPEGQLIRFVRGYGAKVEHTKIRERAIRGMRARAESGRLIPGGSALYGYRHKANRTTYELNPETAPTVRRIFTLALAGGTLRGIAMQLTSEGVPTPAATPGAVWKFTAVRRILRTRAYTGTHAAFRFVTEKDRQTGSYRKSERDEGEQIAHAVPAIIDEAEFDAVQTRLRLNQQHAVRNNRHPEDALLRAGFATCGYCGRSLASQAVTRRAGKRQVYYTCSRRSEPGSTCTHGIQAAILDTAVWSHVEQLLTRPELIAAELERMRSSDPSTDDLNAIERSLTQVVRQQRNLIETLANVNGAAATLIAEKLNGLEAQRDQLTQEREAIFARSRSWQDAQERLTDLQTWCRTAAANLTTMTYQERRTALEGLGVQAKVWRSDHEPRYEIRASIPLGADCVTHGTPSR